MLFLSALRHTRHTVKHTAAINLFFAKYPHLQAPARTFESLSSMNDALNVISENKEAILFYCTLGSYLVRMILDYRKLNAMRLILIVRQAGTSMPSDFESIVKISNINAQDTDGNTALHYACMNGNKDIARVLLSMGANPSIKNHRGEMAFYQAAFAGRLEVIKIFIDVATQYKTGSLGLFSPTKISVSDIVNQQTETGWTPLLAAIFNNHYQVISTLITNGGNLTSHNLKGENALLLATINNNISLVQHILFNANLSKHNVANLINYQDKQQNGTPLYIAAEKGYVDIAALLVKAGARNKPAGKYQLTPLHAAIFNEQDDIAELLMLEREAFIHLSIDGRSVVDYIIHMAAKRGYLKPIENRLLDHYYLINSYDKMDSVRLAYIPFYEAKHTSHLFESLVHKSNNIQDAVFWGDKNTVVECIKRNERNLLLKGAIGTPLAAAAFYRQTDIALYLISQGADIECVNQCNEGILHHAIINDDLKLAEKLCLKKINLRRVDNQGYSCLHTVAKFGRGDMARLLLKHGALRDPKTNHFKNLPTHVAAIAENADVLAVLLFEYGADPNARNINNLTPAQLAQDNEEILALLEMAGQVSHAKSFKSFPLKQDVEKILKKARDKKQLVKEDSTVDEMLCSSLTL